MNLSLSPYEVEKCLRAQKYHQYRGLKEAVKAAYKGHGIEKILLEESQDGTIKKIQNHFRRFVEKCKIYFQPGYREKLENAFAIVIGVYKQQLEQKAAAAKQSQSQADVKSPELDPEELNAQVKEEMVAINAKLNVHIDRLTRKTKLIEKKMAVLEIKQEKLHGVVLSEEKLKNKKESLEKIIAEMEAYIQAPKIANVGWIYTSYEKQYDKTRMKEAFNRLDLDYDAFNYDDIDEAKENLESKLEKVKKKLDVNESLRTKINDLRGEISLLKEDCGFHHTKIEKLKGKLLSVVPYVGKSVESEPEQA